MRVSLAAFLVAVGLAVIAGALYLNAFTAVDRRMERECEDRRNALTALNLCVESESCLILLSDAERLARLARSCPNLPSER